MVRLDLPFVTCAHSVLPVVKPLALIVIRRPGAPFTGERSTRTALTVICSEADSVVGGGVGLHALAARLGDRERAGERAVSLGRERAQIGAVAGDAGLPERR